MVHYESGGVGKKYGCLQYVCLCLSLCITTLVCTVQYVQYIMHCTVTCCTVWAACTVLYVCLKYCSYRTVLADRYSTVQHFVVADRLLILPAICEYYITVQYHKPSSAGFCYENGREEVEFVYSRSSMCARSGAPGALFSWFFTPGSKSWHFLTSDSDASWTAACLSHVDV